MAAGGGHSQTLPLCAQLSAPALLHCGWQAAGARALAAVTVTVQQAAAVTKPSADRRALPGPWPPQHQAGFQGGTGQVTLKTSAASLQQEGSLPRSAPGSDPPHLAGTAPRSLLFSGAQFVCVCVCFNSQPAGLNYFCPAC